MVKNLPANAGDTGLIPGLRRTPGGGNGKPFQYSYTENPMDRGARQSIVHRVTQSWTRLKRLSTYACLFLVSLQWLQVPYRKASLGLNEIQGPPQSVCLLKLVSPQLLLTKETVRGTFCKKRLLKPVRVTLSCFQEVTLFNTTVAPHTIWPMFRESEQMLILI